MKKELLEKYKSILNIKLNEADEIADGIDPTEDVGDFTTDFEDVFDLEDADYVDELVDEIENDTETEDEEENIKKHKSINLNSLYNIDDEKNDYKKTPFKYVNGYWIAVVGILALAKKFPDCPIIHNYLTKPAPITEESLLENGDYFTDPIAAVKTLYDNKIMKYFTWNEFVNFFLELNGNYYREINENTIRNLTEEMIFVDLMPHHMIRETIVQFMKEKISIEDCIEPLYKFNLMFNISSKFQEFCIVHKDELLLSKHPNKEKEEESPKQALR